MYDSTNSKQAVKKFMQIQLVLLRNIMAPGVKTKTQTNKQKTPKPV